MAQTYLHGSLTTSQREAHFAENSLLKTRKEKQYNNKKFSRLGHNARIQKVAM